MRSLFITAFLIAFTFTLTACGDPKPAQYPPSLYKDFEDPLTDEELNRVKQKAADSAEAAEETAEDAAVEAEEAAEEATEEADEAAEDAEEAIEEAAEEVEEAADSY